MNKKALIIIILAVVILGGAAGVYFLVIAPGQNAEPPEMAYTPQDYIVTNVKGTDKLVKATIYLYYHGEDMTEELNKHIPKIRDAIIFVLRNKTEEEYDEISIRGVLAQEIVQSVNGALGIEQFEYMYFNDLVLQ